MKILAVVLGMAAATYLPRLLPVFIIDRFNPPGYVMKWLKCIPYAALGALIFPGILSVEEGSPAAGLAGGAAAVAISIFKPNVIYAVAGSILVTAAVKFLV